MCLACLEYIKGNMKLTELKAAYRETLLGSDKDAHIEEMQTIIYDHDGDEESLKQKIKDKISD